MSDGTIGIDEPASIDKMLDCEQLTVGANTVLRERVQIAGAAAADLATVDATLGLTVNVSDRAARDNGKIDIAAFDVALPAGTNNIGDVDVLSSALPTGASTAANQTTIIGHLDGVEALLTTIDADTGTLAATVDAGEVQVKASDRTATGTMDAATETVTLNLEGAGIPILVLTGTFANGTTTLVFEYNDGTGTFRQAQAMHLANETAAPVLRFVNGLTGGDTLFDNGMYKFLGVSGATQVRVRMPARGGADSVVATWSAGAAQPDVVYAAMSGDINHGTVENSAAITVPPVKVGTRSFFTGTPEAFTTLPTAQSSSSTRTDVSGSAYGHINTQIPHRYIQKTITANAVSREFPLEGVQAWGLRLSGTWTGTVVFSGSTDNGSTWFVWTLLNTTTQAVEAALTDAGSAAAVVYKPIWAAGFTHVRVLSTAWTSGTLTIDFVGSSQAGDVGIFLCIGNIPHDAADTGNPVKIGLKAATGGLPAAVANADRVNATGDVYGRQITRRLDTWKVQHQPVAATQATISQASGGAGIKNVCTSITVTLSSTAAPTAERVVFNLRDGATGAGTILWSGGLSVPAVAGESRSIVVPNLWIEGTAATAMTLESAAAPGANTFATVAMTGTITQ